MVFNGISFLIPLKSIYHVISTVNQGHGALGVCICSSSFYAYHQFQVIKNFQLFLNMLNIVIVTAPRAAGSSSWVDRQIILFMSARRSLLLLRAAIRCCDGDHGRRGSNKTLAAAHRRAYIYMPYTLITCCMVRALTFYLCMYFIFIRGRKEGGEYALLLPAFCHSSPAQLAFLWRDVAFYFLCSSAAGRWRRTCIEMSC